MGRKSASAWGARLSCPGMPVGFKPHPSNAMRGSFASMKACAWCLHAPLPGLAGRLSLIGESPRTENSGRHAICREELLSLQAPQSDVQQASPWRDGECIVPGYCLFLGLMVGRKSASAWGARLSCPGMPVGFKPHPSNAMRGSFASMKACAWCLHAPLPGLAGRLSLIGESPRTENSGRHAICREELLSLQAPQSDVQQASPWRDGECIVPGYCLFLGLMVGRKSASAWGALLSCPGMPVGFKPHPSNAMRGSFASPAEAASHRLKHAWPGQRALQVCRLPPPPHCQARANLPPDAFGSSHGFPWIPCRGLRRVLFEVLFLANPIIGDSGALPETG